LMATEAGMLNKTQALLNCDAPASDFKTAFQVDATDLTKCALPRYLSQSYAKGPITPRV
jgi:hypothetical protein